MEMNACRAEVGEEDGSSARLLEGPVSEKGSIDSDIHLNIRTARRICYQSDTPHRKRKLGIFPWLV